MSKTVRLVKYEYEQICRMRGKFCDFQPGGGSGTSKQVRLTTDEYNFIMTQRAEGKVPKSIPQKNITKETLQRERLKPNSPCL